MKKILLVSAGAIMIYLSGQICGCGGCEANAITTETNLIIRKKPKQFSSKLQE